MQKSKEGTGRIAMWRLGIKNSYTMEATFGGSSLGEFRILHISVFAGFKDCVSLNLYSEC